MTEKHETKPRPWVGELLKIEGRLAYVRYGGPDIPEELRQLGMVATVPIEDIRILNVYCFRCGDYVKASVVRKKESYTIKGDGPFTILANVSVCADCGKELFIPEVENYNFLALYKQYRQKHGLLLPEEIRLIRQRYTLSQKSFSRLLGFRENAIRYYECGTIQNRAHDNLIRKARDPQFVKELYTHKPEAVLLEERETFEERLNRLIRKA